MARALLLLLLLPPPAAAAAAALMICSFSTPSKSAMVEDELFGDLTADDHADDHERAANPQQAASAASAIAMSSRLSEVGGGGLAGHETRSNEAAFHKMGYLEAYDATKEEWLQEGFEVGFREALDLAHSIGRRLGRLVGRTANANGGNDEDGSNGDQQAKRDADAVASKLVARTIRAFLDGQMTQQSDAVSADESLKELQDLENMVKEQSKE